MAAKEYVLKLNAKHNFDQVAKDAESTGATIEKALGDKFAKIGIDFDKGDLDGLFKFIQKLTNIDPSKAIELNLDLQSAKLEKLTSELKDYQDLLDARHGGNDTFKKYIETEAQNIGKAVVEGMSPESLLPRYQALLNLVESYGREVGTLPDFPFLDEIGNKFFAKINPDTFNPITTVFKDAKKHANDLTGQITALKLSISDLEKIQNNPNSFVKNYERIASIGSTLHNIDINPLDEGLSPEEFADGLLKMADSYDKIIERIRTLQNSGDNSDQVKEETGLLYNLANAYEKAFDISNKFDVAGAATDLLPDDWFNRLINQKKLRPETKQASTEFRQAIGQAIKDATSSSDAETQDAISKWLNNQVDFSVAMTDLFSTDYANFFKSLSYGFKDASESTKATEEDIKNLGEELKKLHREERIYQEVNNTSIESGASVKSPKQKAAIMTDLNNRYEKVNAAINELEQQDDGSDEIKEKILMLKGLRQKIVEAFNNSFPKSILAANDYVKREDWLKKNIGEEAERWALNQRSVIEGILRESIRSPDYTKRMIAFDDRMDELDLRKVDLGVSFAQDALDIRADYNALVDSIMSDTAATDENTASHEKNNEARKEGEQASGQSDSTAKTDVDTESTEKNTEAHKENVDAKKEGQDTKSSQADSTAQTDADTASTEKNTQAHEENNKEKQEGQKTDSGSSDSSASMDADTESTERNTQAHKENNEERSKQTGFDGVDYTAVKESLQSIDGTLQSISKSIGSVDEEGGFNNLITSLKTVNGLMDDISQKDFNLIFNEADKNVDTKALLDKEVNKLYQRYSKAYDQIVHVGYEHGYDVDPAGVLANIYGNDFQRTGYYSPVGFIETFEKEALKQLDKQEFISRVQELIKYVKLAAQEEDSEISKYLKELKLPTDDTHLVQRRLASLVQRKQSEQASSIVQDALKRNVQQSTEGVGAEATAMDGVASAAESAAASKTAFVDANKGVGGSTEDSIGKLKEEANAMDQVGDSAKDAAKAKEKLESSGKKDDTVFGSMYINNDFMKQQENLRKFLADGLAEKYIPDTVGELKKSLSDIGHTNDFAALLKFPEQLEKAKRDLSTIFKGSPDKLKSSFDKAAEDLNKLSNSPSAKELIGDRLTNIQDMKDNMEVSYESVTKLKEALREATTEYNKLYKAQTQQQNKVDADYDKAIEKYSNLTTDEYMKKNLPDDFDALKKQADSTEKTTESVKLLNDAITAAQKKIKEDIRLRKEWADITNEAFELSTNDKFGMTTRFDEIEEYAGKMDISESGIAGYRNLVNALKSDIADQQKTLKSEVTNVMKTISSLSSGKSGFFQFSQLLGTDADNGAVQSVLNAYVAKINDATTAVSELKNKWGETTPEVKTAVAALDSYTQSMNESMVKELTKRAQGQIDTIQSNIKKREESGTPYTTGYLDELQKAQNIAEDLIKSLKGINLEDAFKADSLHKFLDDLNKVEIVLKGLNSPVAIEAPIGSVEKLLSKVNKDLDKGGLKGTLKQDYIDLQEELTRVIALLSDATEKQEEFSRADFKKLTDRYNALTEQKIKRGQNDDGFGNKFATAINNQSAQFLATYFSFQDMIRYARQITQTVVATDSALIELKKVSGASNDRIQESFSKSAETAQELGSTITNVINSTADWARLGYNVDQAEELARVTTLYQTVGDNMTQESASKSLVSMLQGFHIDAEDAERVVDSVNEVANNFAIDTAGIGDALQRSAAAFSAAGTDLNKSIALVTTANAVVQDPSSVGTMFKTMSARIRGASTELQELGEEEDEYTKTTSKLRNLVQGLTGFDIMEDENTYKDIYEIIVGIGKEWKNLSDIERASLTEALGGKRGVNTLSAVLNNIDMLEDAYKTAEGAAGSAGREQENYAQSVQFSIDRAKASLEQLANDFLASDLLKGLIEFGNEALKVLDKLVQKFGSVGSIIAAFTGMSTIKGAFGAESIVGDLFRSIADKRTGGDVSKGLFGNIGKILKSFGKDAVVETTAAEVGGESGTAMEATAVPAATASGAAAGQGFTNGLRSTAVSGAAEVGAEAGAAMDTSKVGSELGEGVAEGVVKSVDDVADGVAESVDDVTKVVTEGVVKSADEAGEIISESVDDILNVSLGHLPDSTMAIGEEVAEGMAMGVSSAGVSTAMTEAVTAGTAGATSAGAAGGASAGGAFGTAFSAAALGPILAVAAVVGIAVYQHKKEIDKLQKDAKEAAKTFEETSVQLDSYSSQYEDLYNKMNAEGNTDAETLEYKKQIYALQKDIISTYGDQASGIDLINGNLQTQLDILQNIKTIEGKRDLAKNDKAYRQAEKEMTKQRSYTIGGSAGFNTSLGIGKDLKGLTEEFKENGFELVSGNLGRVNIKFTGDARDANEKLDEFTDRVKQLRDRYSDDEDSLKIIDNVVDGIASAQNSITKTTDKWQEAYNSATVRKAEETSNQLLSRYKDAVNNYNEALATGDADAKDKAATEYQKVISERDQFLSETDKLGHTNKERFGFLFDEIEINRTAKRTSDFAEIMDNINDSTKAISETNMFSPKRQKQMQDFSRELKEARLDSFQLQQIFDTPWDKFGSLSELEKHIRALGTSFGILGDGSVEDQNRIQQLFDMLAKKGFITDSIGDAARALDFSSIFEEFMSNIGTEMSRLDNVNSALAASFTGKGMSVGWDQETHQLTGDVANIIDAYGDLVGFDMDKVFIRTANGVEANADELHKLEMQQIRVNKQEFEYQKMLASQELAKAYNELSLAETQESKEAAYRNIADLSKKLEYIKDMEAYYDGATSAYQRWINAQNASEEGDIYDNILGTAFKRGDELLEKGLVGTNEFRALAELVSGKDLSESSIEEITEAYKGLEKTIPGTTKKLKDFFTEGSEGGINFAKALAELGMATEEDGFIKWDVLNSKKIAEAMGTSTDVIESILGKMRDYGFDVKWFSDDQVEQLDLIDSRIKEAGKDIKKANEAANTSVDEGLFDTKNLNTVDQVSSRINEVQAMLDNPTAFGIDDTQAVALQELLNSLIEKKQILENPSGDQDMTASGIMQSIEVFDQMKEKIEQIKALQDMGINVDVDGDEELQKMAEYIADMPDDLKIALNIPIDADAKAIIEALMNGTIEQKANQAAAAANRASGIAKASSTPKPEVQKKREEVARVEHKEITTENIQKNREETARIEHTEVTASTSGVEEAEQAVQELKDTTPAELHTEVTTNTQGTEEVEQLNQEKEVAAEGKSSTVTVSTPGAEKVPQLNANLAQVPPFKNTTLSVSGDGPGTVSSYLTKLNNIPSLKKTEIRTVYTTVGNKNGGGGTGPYNGTAHYSGTAISGVAHAGGTWGTKRRETALMGELGPEIVVHGTEWRTVGDYGAEFVDLPKGSIVFNHLQTEDLLKHGWVAGRAHVGGTAYSGSTATVSTKTTTKKVKNPSRNNGRTRGNGGGGGGTTTTTTTKKTTTRKPDFQFFDWIERALDNLQHIFEKAEALANFYTIFANQNKKLDEAISDTRKLLNENQEAVNKYNEKANTALVDYRYVDDNGNYATIQKKGKASKKTEKQLKKLKGEKRTEFIQNLNAKGIYTQAQAGKAASKKQEAKISKLKGAAKTKAVKALNKKGIYTSEQRGGVSLKDAGLYSKETLNKYTKLLKTGKIDIQKIKDPNLYAALQQAQEYIDKARECELATVNLKKQMYDLAQQKLDNIIDDYDSLIGHITAANDKLVTQFDLLERSTNSQSQMYSNLSDQADKQQELIARLNGQISDYNAEIQSQIDKGEMVVNEQRWIDAQAKIEGWKTEVIKAQIEVDEINKKIRELNWKNFNNGLEVLKHLNTQLESTLGLFSDLTAFNDDGIITNAGIAQMDMYASLLKTSREEILYYQKALNKVNQDYKDGFITLEQMNQEQREYNEKILTSANSVKKYRDAIISMIKDGINKETDAMSKLIDKRKEALSRQKEADDYSRSVEEKTKQINKLQRQINAMSGDTTAATLAKVKQLTEQLTNAQDELDKTRKDHAVDVMSKGLDDEMKAFRDQQEARIKELEASLAEQEKLISDALLFTTQEYDKTTNMLADISKLYGIQLESDITNPWKNAKTAMTEYGEATTPLTQIENKIAELKAAIEAEKKFTVDSTEVDKLQTQIEDLQTKLAEATLAGVDNTEITALETQISNLKAELAKQVTPTVDTTEINKLQTQINALVEAKNSLEKAVPDIKGGNAENVDSTKTNTAPITESAFAGGKSTGGGGGGSALTDAQKKANEIAAAKKKSEDAKRALDTAVSNLNKAQNAYDTAYANLTKAKAQKKDKKTIDTLQAKVDSTSATLKKASATAKSAGSAYDTALATYWKLDPSAKTTYMKNGALAIIKTGKKHAKSTTKAEASKSALWKHIVVTDGYAPTNQIYYDLGKFLGVKVAKNNTTTATERTNLLTALKKLGLRKGAFQVGSGGWRLTDEDGIGSEAILTKEGVLRQLDAKDTVFNAKQRETLWNLSKMDFSSLAAIPKSSGGFSVTNSYGSLLTVNGNVDRDALPELKEILKQACEYTKKDMLHSMQKKGFR